MRNNLIILTLAQLLLILLFSVFFIFLHWMPRAEAFIYRYMLFRILPIVGAVIVYVIAGKLMTMKGFIDTLVFWIVPAAFWGLLLAVAYFGGGADAFMRGPFRSLWRFPLDVFMLPQVAAMGLLKLKYDPSVQMIFAMIPQTITAVIAWIGLRRYRKMKAYRERRRERREERR
ncbi:MAG: hypothetical protein SPI65_04945 [Peptoniphilus sp.]|nr:hypothetical protein [Peptoniphilus sp.]MDD7362695.1 hypothetical protein [Bacillota bacterium]MDY6044906.1 hypothetical protein [Peptoniphilus sp.]